MGGRLRFVVGLVLLVGTFIGGVMPPAMAYVVPPIAPPPPVAPPVAPPAVSPLPPSLGDGTGKPLWCYFWGSGVGCPSEGNDLPDLPDLGQGESPFGYYTGASTYELDGLGGWLLAGQGEQTSGTAVFSSPGGVSGGPGPLTKFCGHCVYMSGVAGVMEITPTLDTWHVVMGALTPTGVKYELQVRRNSNGWSFREMRQGVQKSFDTYAHSSNTFPITGPERIAVGWRAQKVNNDDRIRTYPIMSFGQPAAGATSGLLLQPSTAWMDPNSDWSGDGAGNESVITWGGSLDNPTTTTGRLLASFALPNATSLSWDVSRWQWLLNGTAGAPTTTPYEPDLPAIDPNEVPELAPAVPVPWPDGWDLPDWDESAPPTSVVPETPRPSLAPEVSGESTDTALATRIMDGFGWLGDRIGGFFDWLVDSLWTMFEWLVERLKELFFQLITALVEIARWIVQQLSTWLQWLAEQIVTALGYLARILIDGFGAVLSWLSRLFDLIGTGLSALGQIITNMITWLGNLIGSWFTWLATYLELLLDALLAGITALFSWLLDGLVAVLVFLFVPSVTTQEIRDEVDGTTPGLVITEAGQVVDIITGATSGGMVCPSFSVPAPINWTITAPTPSDSGCPGNGPGGARTAEDNAAGDVWGWRGAMRAFMLLFLLGGALFRFLKLMPWANKGDVGEPALEGAA